MYAASSHDADEDDKKKKALFKQLQEFFFWCRETYGGKKQPLLNILNDGSPCVDIPLQSNQTGTFWHFDKPFKFLQRR